MACFFIVYFFTLLLTLLVGIFASKSNKRVHKCHRAMKGKIFWGSLITLIYESYQIVIVCLLINLKILSYETSGLKAMSAFCIIFLTLAIVLPIAFIVKLVRNFNRLRNKKFKKAFG